MYLRKSSLLIISIFLFLSTINIAFGQSTDMKSLLGSWRSNSEMGSLSLIFHSSSQLEFDGEMANYTLSQGAIRVFEDYGYIDYPYSLQGDNLIISFPEGYQLEFTRISRSPSASSTPDIPIETQLPQSSQTQHVDQTKPSTTSSFSLSEGEVGDPQWGFAFRPPAGWKYKKSGEGILLGHDTVPGMIIIFPHTYVSLQAVQTAMMEGLQEEGVIMTPASQLSSLGTSALTGEYQGIWQGQQAKGRGIGTLSPQGGGAMIIAVTTTDKYGPQLSGPAEQIAKEMRYFPVDASNLMRHFAGYWWYYSGTSAISHEQLIYLGADGTYREKREDAADVSNLDQYGNVVNQYLGNFQDRGSGRWTARGNKYEGVISVTRADGSSFDIEYRVKPSQNQRFGDYYFNGTLYHYATEEDLKLMDY